MKRGFLILAALVALTTPARAQFTQVSGTVTDPMGVPYAGGTVSMRLVPTGTAPTVGGLQFSAQSAATLDSTGSFIAQLVDNNLVTPGGTQWVFTVCATPGVAPPWGFGSVCFTSAPITITGASQSVSAALSALATVLVREGRARYMTPLAADPATCDPARGEVYYNTVASAPRYCSAPNTWTAFGGGGATAWNAITNPAGNLSLTMGTNTSTFASATAAGAPACVWCFTDTWNNVAYSGPWWKVNITDTSSAAAALFFDWQVGAVSRFKVDKTGAATFAGAVTASSFITNGSGQSYLQVFGNTPITTGAVGDVKIGWNTGDVLTVCEGGTACQPAILGTRANFPNAVPVRGSIFYANVAPAWTTLGVQTAGKYPRWDGTDLIASTLAASGVGGCTNQFTRTLNADAAPTCATVAKADAVSTFVHTDQANTYSTGAQSFAAATSLLLPASAGYAPTADGSVGYDTTQKATVAGGNGAVVGRFPRLLATLVCNSTACVAWGTGATAGTFTTNCISGGADANCTNAGVAETAFGFSYTIPANFLGPNNSILVDAYFEQTATAAVPTFLLKMKVAGTIVYQSTTAAPAAAAVYSVGMAAKIQGVSALGAAVPLETGLGPSPGIAPFTKNIIPQPVTGFDTTATNALTFTLQLGTGTIGNFLRLRQIDIWGI